MDDSDLIIYDILKYFYRIRESGFCRRYHFIDLASYEHEASPKNVSVASVAPRYC